jgi:O-acetyl-ADP-ribose deacetylase (regulator of RNase III)
VLTSAVHREIGAREVAHLEGKRWRHGATMEAQGHDGATVAELRLRKNHSGERGPDRPERGRAHRRVSE